MAELREAVAGRLEQLERDDLVPRIWRRDHTVWGPDPAEIADRLGWLSVHEWVPEKMAEIAAFVRGCVADHLRAVILCGMGGSSLAPEVFRAVFGVTPSGIDVIVLDSTHPDQVRDAERGLDPAQTLYLISSKSGTTIETGCHLAYFWERIPHGGHFAAITDPDTPLHELAADREFRHVFLNPPDVGGRYSALSLFGLVPAALIGVDLGWLLAGAARVAARCGPEAPLIENPAARLGASMAEAALAGRDKLTLVLPRPVAAMGSWIEQLVAESTGKDSRGIVPVEGEALGPPGVYGNDRLFVVSGDPERATILKWLVDAGHPVEHVGLDHGPGLAGSMFAWEMATAIAGAILGINPFDQPDVQSAKDATARALEHPADEAKGDGVRGMLRAIEPGEYLAIQAYLPRNRETSGQLQAARMKLRDGLGVATTVGFGPRFLHSTGQLHKGGPPTGRFVQIVDPGASELPIPGKPFTFAELLAAQADGDLAALRARGRSVVRASLAELEAASWS